MIRHLALLSILAFARVAVADELQPLCIDGWCWDAPRPHGRDLRAVFPFAADDVWAVGDRLITHFDGHDWSGFNFADDKPFFLGLWGARRDDLWAVGTSIVHWDGKTWSLTARLDDFCLYGVWGSAGDDVWAVGQKGTVLRWNGKKWTRVNTGGPDVIWRAVSGSGRNDVWIVGDHGEALHWNGTALQPVHIEDDAAGEPPRLYGVFSRARDDVWVAGLPEAVFHFDGKRWQRTRGTITPKGGDLDNQPGQYLTAIWGDKEQLWAVSAAPVNRIMRLSGDGKWTDDAEARFPLAAIRDGWAVGNSGTILRRGEQGWVAVNESPLIGISAMLQDGDVPFAAVGQAQAIVERHRLGWQIRRVDSPTLFALDGRFEDYWAVGQDGATLHFDGKRWIAGHTPTAEILSGVYWRARDDVWAVGMHAAVEHWNGRAWASVKVPTKAALSGVWARTPRDIWLAGENGTLLRGDGHTWRAVDIGVATPWLMRVRGRAADDVWAVGWGGVVVHFDGKAWTRLPAIAGHADADLRQARLGRDFVAVAGNDFVARWDGSRWQIVADHLDEVRDIVITSDDEIWIAQAAGILFHAAH